jgi:hypothetical protein
VLKKTVHDFFIRDDVSRATAGKIDTLTKAVKGWKEPQKHFNVVLFEDRTPAAWSRRVVVLFFKILKKGDKSLLKNYWPISLLTHVYKLFFRNDHELFCPTTRGKPTTGTGLVSGRIWLDFGFDIHTVRQIILKTEEYKQTL